MRALIVGGGVAGCAAAHQLELLGNWDVTLVEQSHELGAGVRTKWYGGMPYTYGPRHLLTQDEKLYAYMDGICPLRNCGDHRFWSYVEQDAAFYDFPIHEDDIARMPDQAQIDDERTALALAPLANPTNLEEYWLSKVGPTLYAKMVNTYSKKMWRITSNTVLDSFEWSVKGVAVKSGEREAWDTAMSAYPIAANGYDNFFDYTTKATKVLLNTVVKLDLQKRRAKIGPAKHSTSNLAWTTFDLIVSTASPDDAGDYIYGRLPYIGRDFMKLMLPVEFALPEHVYFAYYCGDESFTRVTEFKKFSHHKSPHTLIGIEIPSANGRHYPMPTKTAMNKAKQYHDLSSEGVCFAGRHGSYRYGIDIGHAIGQAFTLRDILKSGSTPHGPLGDRWRTI